MQITHRRIALYIDLVACFVFIPLVIMVLPMQKWITHSIPSVLSLVAYVYIIYFAYRMIHLPQLVLRKKYVLALLAVIFLVSATVIHTCIPFDLNTDHLTERQIANREGYRRQVIWFLFLIISGFSLCIDLATELFKQIMLKQEIELCKDRAELMLYKSQINPHFLFNTLNTLYALVISGSDKTESAFVKFSDMLRYTYSQAGDATIPIGTEIEYISQYVDLQQLRLNRHTRVDMTTDIDDDSMQVLPMVLITFIENAFKYGTSSEEDCVIRIVIKLKNGELSLTTENKIMREGGSGVGLDNCRKRLDLVYGGRYSLYIDKDKGIYRSILTINLK